MNAEQVGELARKHAHGRGPSPTVKGQGAYIDYVEHVRASNDIVEVVGEYLELNRSFMAICPFHNDKTPSFSVNPKGQYFHCFGCNVGGDVFRLIEMMEGLPFPKAVEYLALRSGVTPYSASPGEVTRFKEQRIVQQILAEAADYYQARLRMRVGFYLMRDRGLTKATIRRFRIGWADGTLNNHLLEAKGYPVELCIRAGLLCRSNNGHLTDTFRDRVVFPNTYRGKVLHFSGRSLDGKEPKYLNLKGEIPHFYNEEAALNEVVFLTEGVLDALSLESWDYRAIGLLSANGFSPQDAEKFGAARTVYLCFDGDDAGRQGALRTAQLLGSKARILSLPEGKDPNDLYREGNREALESLVQKARDVLTYEIELIPTNVSKADLPRLLDPILGRLAACDPATAEIHLSRTIKERFTLTYKEVDALRSIVKSRRNELKTDSGPLTAEVNAVLWDDHRVVNPAQDYVDDVALFCVHMTCESKGKDGKVRMARQPFIVTSKRQMFPLTAEELAARGFRRTRDDQVPSDMNCWSTRKKAPNSVYAFLNGETRVDPTSLISRIEELFRTYLDYPDDLYYPFLALWCVGTYLFMLFESYPYVFLSGTGRAGKTRTIEVASPLCFNSVMAASVSDASMFRSTENDRCTIFHDEAGKFRGHQKGDLSERLEIYNSGYKRSGAVRRCVGDNHVPTTFSTYSPKLLANVVGLDQTCADRTITLAVQRTKSKMPKFSYRGLERTFVELRDSLYILAMTHHKEIAQIYDAQEMLDELRDREDELWGPIFTLAEFFDAQRLYLDPSINEGELLLPKMIRLALSCRGRRLQSEMDENDDQRILMALLEYVRRHSSIQDKDGCPIGYYLSDEILGAVRNLDGLKEIEKNSVTRALNRLHVLHDEEDKKYLRVDPVTRELRREARQQMCYRLTPERLRDVAERYLAPEIVRDSEE